MNKITLLSALLLVSTFPAAAHIPTLPNLACSPGQPVHDWVLPGSVSVTTAGGPVAVGALYVFDGSIDCPLVPLVCEDDIVVDDGGTPEDPSDDIVIPCDPPLDTPLIPVSDGDPEWGIGGAKLPDDHHTGDDGVVSVSCAQDELDLPQPLVPSCSWAAGRDGDDSGIVDGGDDPTDCLSAPISGSGIVTLSDLTDGRTCDAAGAAGVGDILTWVFAGGNVEALLWGGPVVAVHYDPDQDCNPWGTDITNTGAVLNYVNGCDPGDTIVELHPENLFVGSVGVEPSGWGHAA